MTRAARSVASALAAAALLIGVPWLLATTIGDPVNRWPDLLAGDVNNQVVLAVLSVVVWLAWAQFAVAFAVELVSAVRRTPIPARIPGVLAAQQGLARALVNGALLLLPVTVAGVAPAGQALAMTATLPPPAAAAAHTPDLELQRPAAPPQTAAAPRAATQDVTLTDGGARTWWDLAAQHLGDGAAWSQLWSLNDGRVQADGTVLTSARTMLQPGWTIAVPATGGDVQVRPGDTLSQIAVDHGIPDWTALWPVNADRPEPGGQRFTDPDYIEPGWTISIPPDTIPAEPDADRADAAADTAADTAAAAAAGSADIVVTVEAGDTLSQIAAAHGADTDAVTAANRGTTQPGGGALADPDSIRPGWRLVIPTPTAAAADNTGAAPGGTGTPDDNAGPDAADGGGAGPADTGPAVADSTPAPPAPAPAPAAVMPTTTGPSTTQPATTQPATAVPDPTGTAPAAEPSSSSSSSLSSSSSWAAALAVFGGGGGVLAAVLLAALLRYRRRQFRHRLPGHRVPATPAELVGMERALLTVGAARAADAAWLDEALRGLAHQLGEDPRGRLPDVVAACLTDAAVTLVLQHARTDPPGAWAASPDGRRWTLRRDEPTGYDPEQRGYLIAPFPALATVGSSTAGEHWLLDLERIGSLTVTGDPDRATALARFLAAELAHNTWSDSVQVTLVGFGAEMALMHPQRLAFAADAAAAVDAVGAQRRSVTRLIDDAGVDVLDGRLRGVAGDGWAPHVLLIDAAGRQAAAVGELVAAVTAGPARSTVALVITDTDTGAGESEQESGPDGAGWRVSVDGDGVLTVPALGVSLIAQQLPAGEAAQLAQLLAFTATTDPRATADDHPSAAGEPATAGDPVAACPTEAGVAAASGRWGRPGSVLPLPDHVYLEHAATTAEDLDVLAPPVPAEVRAEAETADTDLDRDVSAWRDPADPRPKVTLLGVPAVRAGGRRFSAFNIEAVAYLATHVGGVGIERYASDLWPEDPTVVQQTRVKSKVRTSISQVRKLLGINPRTGTDYLPRNAGAPGAVYRLDGDVLVDADLFRRLRVRGLARGADGVTDLWAALDLVQGPPFHDRRPGGYGWLAGVPLDHEYTGLIVDLAHVLATHHLADGDPERAAAAAQAALRAGSSADGPLLDLVAACQAQGQDARAEAYIKQILVNHDVQDEEDLPPRTYQILRRRRWLPPAA